MLKADIKNHIADLRSFSFIGDPGCDGLGAEIMSIFHLALNHAAGDIVLIGGDIVPNGSKHFYENITALIDGATQKPVYMLCGNHDTKGYEYYFGKKDYYIYSDIMLLIFLDNSKRVFSEHTLNLLALALKENPRDSIVIAFHIPPPNSVSKNSVSREEWDKALKIIAPYRDQVKYLLCGHIHSYFEDTVDGMKLIASGGGGARIEKVDGIETPYNHWVEFFFDAAGSLRYERKDVSLKDLQRGISEEVKNALYESFTNECKAHVLYRLYGEEAIKQGYKGIAGLFFATADAEFFHARNHYYAMGAINDTRDSILQSIENEHFEVSTFYRNFIELAKTKRDGLAQNAFRDAAAAERVHAGFFEDALKALDGHDDYPEKQYYTCTSCGYTFSGSEKPKICPVCGAPHDKIKDTPR